MYRKHEEAPERWEGVAVQRCAAYWRGLAVQGMCLPHRALPPGHRTCVHMHCTCLLALFR